MLVSSLRFLFSVPESGNDEDMRGSETTRWFCDIEWLLRLQVSLNQICHGIEHSTGLA